MPVLKLLVKKSFEEKQFFEEIAERGKSTDLVKNPFQTEMKVFGQGKELLVLFDIEPVYPSMIPKAGLFLAFVSLLFGWVVTFFCSLFLVSTFFLWSETFFFMILKKGRKRKGLKGKVTRLNDKTAFKRLITWDK